MTDHTHADSDAALAVDYHSFSMEELLLGIDDIPKVRELARRLSASERKCEAMQEALETIRANDPEPQDDQLDICDHYTMSPLYQAWEKRRAALAALDKEEEGL